MPIGGIAGLLRALRSERDGLGLALVALIGLHVAMAIGTALSPDVARWAMRRFHLGTASFAAWASYQLGPWMYNFENQVLVSPEPLRARDLGAFPGMFWFINHQSARVFTFADHRPWLFALPGDRYVYLRSRYRDAEVLSGFHLQVHPHSQPHRATVTRLDPSP